MTTLTVRISDELDQALQQFCKEEDRSKSWLLKKALQEKLEDWQDLRIAKKGRAQYEKNPHLTIGHEALIKELGIKKKNRK